jgi:hypothetical protein
MVRYGLMSRPFLTEALPKKYDMNSKEYSDQQAKILFEHNLDKLEKAKENKDDQGMNWQSDPHGVPSWLKWGD